MRRLLVSAVAVSVLFVALFVSIGAPMTKADPADPTGGVEFSSSSGPWTTWYKKKLIFAILQLAQMRKNLERNNLFDPYHRRPEPVTCGPETKRARTADGTCNDLKNTTMGAVNTRIGRNIKLEASHPESLDKLLSPNPREISLKLMTRNEFKPVSFLNLVAVGWIQFMIHDWFSHGENEPAEPYFIPLSSHDPFGQKEMMILRTLRDPSRTYGDRDLPPTYLNEVTHWWDGSQLYGSDIQTLNRLRAFRDGLLIVKDDGRLPLGGSGVEQVGMSRNWWLGLSMMHHLFVKEHNAIAQMLKHKHPSWSDQKLFDTARLINAAVMAKIHTVEWTPAILANRTLRTAMRANWYGLLNPTQQIHPPFEIIKEPILFGLVGGKKELHGVSYNMTEEFTSVYRMHPLLPEEIAIHSAQSGRLIETVPVGSTRDEGAHRVSDRLELGDILYSMGTAHPGALTLNNYPRFLQNIEMPIVGKMDMATVDIFRDRERGVPRYNEFRRQVGLKPIRAFEDITDDAQVIKTLRELYSNDIERIDLMVGCLAESHRPYGFGFGETQFQIFIIQATRRLQADRFYTSSFNEANYTREGIKWIEASSMSDVLIRHHPKLAPSLKGVETAFNPWNRKNP